MRRFRTATREVIFAHGLFNLERRKLVVDRDTDTDTDTDTGSRDRTERQALVIDSPDWVQIIPVLDDGRLLMIRQFRYGTESIQLELPGGMVERGESSRIGAERELLEETGYRASGWRRLGDLDPNPAIMNNRLGIWLAEGLEQVGEPDGDDDEEIELVPLTLEQVEEEIRLGGVRHALMLSSLHLFRLDELDR